MPPQRIRVQFAKGDRVRFISHLDVLRYWERCLRRAGLPLSYSQGFTPHPKLAFAGPLPLGFLAEGEVMDVTLDERVGLDEFQARLREQTTADLAVTSIEEVALALPAPQASLAWADYAIELPGVDEAEMRAATERFLALDELPWTEVRHDKPRTYDLRAAVAALAVEQCAGGVRLVARLRASQEMMARPEQLLEAMAPGLEIARVTRLRLLFDDVSPAHEAWRRRGRFEQ